MTSLGMRSARISRSSPELIARKYGMPYGKEGTPKFSHGLYSFVAYLLIIIYAFVAYLH